LRFEYRIENHENHSDIEYYILGKESEEHPRKYMKRVGNRTSHETPRTPQMITGSLPQAIHLVSYP
jgi:hypothetical protein